MRAIKLDYKYDDNIEIVNSGRNKWNARDYDPKIYLSCNEDINPGHYYFDVKVDAKDSPNYIDPILYVDYGSGYVEDQAIRLDFHYIGGQKYRAWVILNRAVSSLRFDPSVNSGYFYFGSPCLVSVARLKWYYSLVRALRTDRQRAGHGWTDDLRKLIYLTQSEGISGAANRLRRMRFLASIESGGDVPVALAPQWGSSENAYFDVYQLATAVCEGYRDPHFAADRITPVAKELFDTKLIAYYLPQFHPFPENDAWWGKGFTEWTNVTKAVPKFVGHYQPKLPSDLGFYDLRLVDTMRAQAEMAARFGVSAFCFHFYWFGGKRLMETPLLNFLDATDINIDFCLCWANENWTRRWDGAEHEMLIGQEHSPEDDEAFLRYVSKYFADQRYIKIDGKPVLLIYRAGILPDAFQTTQRWRALAKQLGYPDLYLVATTSFGLEDFRSLGFDAIAEFPPHAIYASEMVEKVEKLDARYSGAVFNYETVVRFQKSPRKRSQHPVHPCVMPAWDNTARRPLSSHVFHGATPTLYREWLTAAFKRVADNPANERFVFINAWNEWAEGAYLEPDRRYGFANLWATASAIESQIPVSDSIKEGVARHNRQFAPQSRRALAIHIFYPELAHEISHRIPVDAELDIYLTINELIDENQLAVITKEFPGSYIEVSPNVGRDVFPFLHLMKTVNKKKYDWVCKIHTKRSPHISDGNNWRNEIYDSLLTHTLNSTGKNKSAFKQASLGILAPPGSLISMNDPWSIQNNVGVISKYLSKLGIKADLDNEDFVAGTMFWFRPVSISKLIELDLTEDDFGVEMGRIDGTVAHGIERLFGIIARANGFSVKELQSPKVKTRNLAIQR